MKLMHNWGRTDFPSVCSVSATVWRILF